MSDTVGDIVGRLGYELHCLDKGGRQWTLVWDARIQIEHLRAQLQAANEARERAEAERDRVVNLHKGLLQAEEARTQVAEAALAALQASTEGREPDGYLVQYWEDRGGTRSRHTFCSLEPDYPTLALPEDARTERHLISATPLYAALTAAKGEA